MGYDFGSMFNQNQINDNALMGEQQVLEDYSWGSSQNPSKGFEMFGQNSKKSGGAGTFSQADPSGIAGGAMDFVGKGMEMLTDINLSTSERMDERGSVTHDVDWAGNVGGMAVSGAMLGGSIVPGWGHVIGAGVGLIAGTAGSIIDSDRQPDSDDIRRAGEAFDLGNTMKTIRGEDTFAVQQTMTAEEGMDVKGDVKQIEVEQDELVLRKTGKSFKKVADFRGGKPHEMGGEQYVATEGDIIIPGKDRLKVNRMLKNRRWSAIESLRQKLPSDTGQQMAPDGISTVDPPKKKKSINVYTYNPMMDADEYEYKSKSAEYKDKIKNYTKNKDGSWYDMTFTNEFNRGKSVLEGQYDKVNHIPVYKSGAMPDMIRGNVGGDIMIMDHSGDRIGGSQLKSIGNAITDSKAENCYMGTCHGETVVDDFGTEGDYNLFVTPSLNQWKGFNPGKKGMEGMFPGGSVQYKSGKKVEYKMGTKAVKIGYAQGSKEIMPAYEAGTSAIEGRDDEDAIKRMIYKKLTDNGYTPVAARGIIINLGYETGGFQFGEELKDNNQGTKGFGIAQWTNTKSNNRRTQMERWMEDNDKNLHSIGDQVDYLMYEIENVPDNMPGGKNFTKAKLNKAKTVKDSARMFMKGFEAPANQSDAHLEKRMKHDYDPLDALKPVELTPEQKTARDDKLNDLFGMTGKGSTKGDLLKKLDSYKGEMTKEEKDLVRKNIDEFGATESMKVKDNIPTPIADPESRPEGTSAAARVRDARIGEEDFELPSVPGTTGGGSDTPALRPKAKIEDSPFYSSEGVDPVGIDTNISGITMPETVPDRIPSGDSEIPPGANKTSIGSNVVKGLGFVADYMPALYNIVRGTEKPSKVPRNFVNPQTRKYVNMGQPQMNAIDQAFEVGLSNARNLSGGMMANYRSNVEAAWSKKLDAQGKVNLSETVRADQIASQNIGIRNRADEFNTQVNTKADIMDMQSEATTKSFMAQGMQDIANIKAVKTKDANARRNEDLMLKMIGSENFDLYGFKG